MIRRMFLLIAGSLLWKRGAAFELNYDELIILDAERLAETGIKRAYDELRPKLAEYVAAPAEVIEIIDSDHPSYSVSCNGQKYFIYGGADQDQSWERATFALFDIVNRQLAGTDVRLFAINGGNELGGMFLTLEQFEAAKKSSARANRPYLPAPKAH